jgi:hypothetical protein
MYRKNCCGYRVSGREEFRQPLQVVSWTIYLSRVRSLFSGLYFEGNCQPALKNRFCPAETLNSNFTSGANHELRPLRNLAAAGRRTKKLNWNLDFPAVENPRNAGARITSRENREPLRRANARVVPAFRDPRRSSPRETWNRSAWPDDRFHSCRAASAGAA